MTDSCDLCSKPIDVGEPRFGGTGNGGRSGAMIGSFRHWRCHVDKFGRPGSEVLAEKRPGPPIGLSPATAPRKPASRVLAPKVGKGPLNRSPNATRAWTTTGRVVSEMGRRRIEISCPFCFATFWAFVWSLAGGGKRCPNCRAMFGSTGTATAIEGNEDLT